MGLAETIANLGVPDIARIRAEVHAAWDDFEQRRSGLAVPGAPAPAPISLNDCVTLKDYLAPPRLDQIVRDLNRLSGDWLPRLEGVAAGSIDTTALCDKLRGFTEAICNRRRWWLAQELLEALQTLEEACRALPGGTVKNRVGH